MYQKNDDELAMYFIAETKWDKNAGGLSDDEVIKINCAERHFEAVNESITDTVKYAWVNAYKDSTKDQSFPLKKTKLHIKKTHFSFKTPIISQVANNN